MNARGRYLERGVKLAVSARSNRPPAIDPRLPLSLDTQSASEAVYESRKRRWSVERGRCRKGSGGDLLWNAWDARLRGACRDLRGEFHELLAQRTELIAWHLNARHQATEIPCPSTTILRSESASIAAKPNCLPASSDSETNISSPSRWVGRLSCESREI